MTPWLVWRLVKLVAFGLLCAGVVGALRSPDPDERARSAFGLATVGWVGAWLSGYGLTELRGVSLGAPWILGSMLTSLVGLAATARAALRGPTVLTSALAAGGLGMATGLMVLRLATPDVTSLGAVGVGVLALAAGVWGRARDEGASDLALARAWFRWIARAEGLSLILLVGLYVPIKYGAGIEIDGGTGGLGWLHGVLFMLYVVSVATLVGPAGWSLGRTAAALVASLVPFGTFAFEWRVRP